MGSRSVDNTFTRMRLIMLKMGQAKFGPFSNCITSNGSTSVVLHITA